MGANCCVAARNKPSPLRNCCDVPNYRSVRHSPSWSFRWDNRTHIEDIMDTPSRFSHDNSANVSSEIKSLVNTETEGLSDGGNSSDFFHASKLRKSSSKVTFAESSKSVAADRSVGSASPPEDTSYMESPATTITSETNPKISTPSTSRSISLKSDATSSKKSIRSPIYQLSRQISDSRIPSLTSLNESCSPESRSSDGWSMRAFSELVAASSVNKIPRFSSEIQICNICSKLLREKSPWSVQKIVSNSEISTAAVLFCGHVYHAECLETVTSELEQYDPPCPICTSREKPTFNLSGKAEMKANKISSPRAKSSSSFLRRHFSVGSRSVSENEVSRKKGFWGRYR